MSQSEVTSSVSASSLTDYLINRIRREGPISFHDWMREALYNPSAGYYMRSGSQIWGSRGDYRTSPETSELFAATLARYVAGLFAELGTPGSFRFVECGPGDGSFAQGMLTSLRDSFPEVYEAMRYDIDEMNPDRRRSIADKLKQFANKIDFISLERLPQL